VADSQANPVEQATEAAPGITPAWAGFYHELNRLLAQMDERRAAAQSAPAANRAERTRDDQANENGRPTPATNGQ